MGAWRTAAAAVLGACLALPAGAVEDDCDPAVERALVENAETGARDDVRIVRHREMGIRDPASLFDLSCVTRMFDYRHANILYRPDRAMADILGLLQRALCDKAREAFGGFVGRGLDPVVFTRDLPPLPGLDFVTERENPIEDVERERRSQAREAPPGPRRENAPAVRSPEPRPGGGTSRPDVLRSLLGGGRAGEDGR